MSPARRITTILKWPPPPTPASRCSASWHIRPAPNRPCPRISISPKSVPSGSPGTPRKAHCHGVPRASREPQNTCGTLRSRMARRYPRVVSVRPTTEGLFVHGEIDFQVPAGHSVVLWAKAGFRQNANSRARANFSITYLNGADFLSLANNEKRYDGLLATLHADSVETRRPHRQAVLQRRSRRRILAGRRRLASCRRPGGRHPAFDVPGGGGRFAVRDQLSASGSPDAFADFAAGLARRYPQIQAWEIWNEPNTSFFWRPAVNAQAYVALLREDPSGVESRQSESQGDSGRL